MEDNSPLGGKSIWTVINGQKGIIIFQGDDGLAVVKLSLLENTTCYSTGILCIDATVTYARNTNSFKVGDTGRIGINLTEQQENLSGFSVSQGSSTNVNVLQTWITPAGDYSLTLDRTGGFAGISKKIEIISKNDSITVTNRTGISILDLDNASDTKLKSAIMKSRFFDLSIANYPPTQGSADYFLYSLEITQGQFSTKVNWTDTSPGVPLQILTLRDIIADVANKANSTYHQ